MAVQKYALGVGDIYMLVADTIPTTDTELEIEGNFIGSTSGGCSLSYNFEKYDIKDDNDATIDSLKQNEKVGFKGNILTFDLITLAKLTANAEVDDTETETVLKLGSNDKSLQKIVIRYVHTFKDGKKMRVTLLGNSASGFELSFTKDKETIIPFEISALNQADGLLCDIRIEK